MTLATALLLTVLSGGPERPLPPALDFSDVERDYQMSVDEASSINRKWVARAVAGACALLGGTAAGLALANKSALESMPPEAPVSEKRGRITYGKVAAGAADGLFAGAVVAFGLSFAF